MTVYVEYALLDNFTMDFLLLFFAALTLKVGFRWWRITLGAFVGTVTAIGSVFLYGVWAYVGKIVCLFAMCITAIGVGKKLFWFVLLTLAYTFLAGGTIVGVFNLLKISYVTENGFCYNAPVPLFVFFVAIVLVSVGGYALHFFVIQTRQVAPFLRKVTVRLDNTYNLQGFCDSGNSVSCNGVPVCFVTDGNSKICNEIAQKLLCGKTHSVQIQTLAGSKTIVAVCATLQVENCSHSIMLAYAPQKCKTQYQIILHSSFCNAPQPKMEAKK